MRFAAITDAWRRVRKAPSKSIERVKIGWTEIPRLTDGEFEFTKPITLICGENGAGKSTLLHTIYEVLGGQGSYTRPHKGNVHLLEVDIAQKGTTERLRLSLSTAGTYFYPADGESLLVILDTGMHVPAMLKYIRQEQSFTDLLEGLAPRKFDKEELDSCSFIVGRDYTEISVVEIEDSSFEETFPYFSVISYGKEYKSEDMGYGELAALYLMWTLSRVQTGTLLLIEEPEAFLSPISQIALIDFLAKQVPAKDLKIVITSHSGAIATRMENDEIVFVSRGSGLVVIDTPARTSDLITRLGLVPDKSFIFFVEDKAASIFLRVVVDHYSKRLSGRGEYVVCDGYSGIDAALAAIPTSIRAVVHLGVLDGDMRATRDEIPNRLVFLPGELAPELLLINHFKKYPISEISGRLYFEEIAITKASARAGGTDIHEWPHIMARELGVTYEEFLRRLAVNWAIENQNEVVKFIEIIDKAGR